MASRLEQIKHEAKKELARRNYLDYCKYVYGEGFKEGKHIKLICESIEKVIERKVSQRILLISCPPQHGKSQTVTECYPSYHLGKYPNSRIIAVSYGDDLATKFGRRNKAKIEEFGKELFDVSLNPNKKGDGEFELLDKKGSMISRGIMAGITGQPADVILIDDPIKNRQEAESETKREAIWSEYLDSINTRLSANGVIILIMTRWHEDDLVGKLLKNMPEKCLEINIPLEAEENDILGREIGDSLFPEIGKDKAWLKDFKKSYNTKEGSRSWNALMQGRPSAANGELFKRSYFKYYDELPETFDQALQSWDCTFKDNKDSDYVVGTVWGRKGPDKYLIDMVRARMDFPTTIRAIMEMTRKYPKVYTKLIEDKANGSAVIQVLRKKIQGIMPITPTENKISRANSVLPQFECGNIYLPRSAAWIEILIDEFIKFPNGLHDDIVDSSSQALSNMLNEFTLPEEKVEKKLPYALQTQEIRQGGYQIW